MIFNCIPSSGRNPRLGLKTSTLAYIVLPAKLNYIQSKFTILQTSVNSENRMFESIPPLARFLLSFGSVSGMASGIWNLLVFIKATRNQEIPNRETTNLILLSNTACLVCNSMVIIILMARA